jgi:Flp pilus assembly protein TadG
MKRRLLPSHTWIEGQRGQGLVEMALVGLILVLILSGMIDLGRTYFAYIAIADAAAEGATYGATFPDTSEGEIRSRTVGASGGQVSIDPGLVSIITDTQTITVTVAFRHTLLTPLIQTLFGEDTLLLQQQAIQPILE